LTKLVSVLLFSRKLELRDRFSRPGGSWLSDSNRDDRCFTRLCAPSAVHFSSAASGSSSHSSAENRFKVE
jgi:hypothetical protein